MSVLQKCIAVLVVAGLSLAAVGALGGDNHGERPSISVAAQGYVEAEPDIAIVSGRISAEKPDVKRAVDQARTKLDALVRFARKAGVDKEKLQAAQIEVHPLWHHSRDKPRELVGFQAHANFAMVIEDIDALSDIYAGLSQVGVSDLSPAQFDFSERAELEQDAIANAVKKARSKAAAALEPLGQEPGDAISVSIGSSIGQQHLFGVAERAMSVDMAAPQMNVGHHKIQATVKVVFAIED